jgi:Phage portal protein, SPP1 Gp6-like
MDLNDWRAACSRKLDDQARRAEVFMAYYDGTEEVPAILDTDERQTFRRLLADAGANWSELVVNAVAERLTVTGFRFGAASDAAWLLWQANSMDADAELVQTDALVCASSFVLVQPDDDTPGGVSITAESPLEATVLYEPGSRRRRAAGYKRFGEAGGATTEVVILPEIIATWEGPNGEPRIDPNPAGLVGMIEIAPQPRTYGPPRSELAPVIPIQDRINLTIFNRLVASDFGAFRQVWATGVKIARETVGTDPDSGEPIVRPVAPFNVGANRLLANENPQGRFGVFEGDPLAGYLAAVEQDVTQLAAITQTPAHYLTGTIANLSADAIRAAEAGLVAKIARRARHVGEAWEEVMRTALGLVGNPAAANVEAEVIWADPEYRSEAARVDALLKMSTLGVPTEALWEKWGASPQEIARWQAMAATERQQQAAAQAAAIGVDALAGVFGGANGGASQG